MGWAPLDADQRGALRAEAIATNISRLSAILPVMVLVHLAHVPVFWLSGPERAAAEPQYVLWRDSLVATHIGTAGVAALLALWVFLRDRVGGARWIGPAAVLAYLMHGDLIAGIDQLNSPNVSPYMAYALCAAFLVAVEPPTALVLWGAGLVGFVAAIQTMQPVADIRLTLLPNGPSVTIASLVIAFFLYAARRRDFVQRLTIDRQRDELRGLNADLELKVEAQVAEIVARATEIEQLNAQLQEQVRDRSRELARALERLALQAHTESVVAPGTVLGGHFEVTQPIGAGAMGAVYQGIDRRTGTQVAIKVIRSSAAPLPILRRFLREARAAASVAHPAIVKMLEIDIAEDGTFYQVQELVHGETLQATLRKRPQLPPGPTARLLAVLCDALAAAHAQGVVHRDVKPANLMLCATAPGLKVLDFGISKVPAAIEGDPSRDDEHTLLAGDDPTRMGVVLGTPAYMGPEQLIGSHNATDRSDVYAVGVIAFLALSGEHPSAHGTGRIAPPDPEDLADRLERFPEDLAPLVAAALLPDPADRPSAAALARALGAIADSRDQPSLEALVRSGAFSSHDIDGPTLHPNL